MITPKSTSAGNPIGSVPDSQVPDSRPVIAAIPAGGFDSPKIATSYAKRRGWKVTRNPGLDD